MIEHTTEALRMFTEYRHDQHKQFCTIPVDVLNTFQNLWTSCDLCQTRLMESNSFFNLLCFVRYHISILQLGSVQFEVFLMHTLRGFKGVKTVSNDDVLFRQLLNMLIDCMQSVIDNTESETLGSYDCGLFLQAVSQVIYHAKHNQFSQHLVGIWGVTAAFVDLTLSKPEISEEVFCILVKEHFEYLEACGSSVPPALELHNLRWLVGQNVPGIGKHVLVHNLLQFVQTLYNKQLPIQSTCACFDAIVYYVEMHGPIVFHSSDESGLYAKCIVIARRILVKRYYMTDHNASETDMLSSVVRFIHVILKWTSLHRNMFRNDFVYNTIRDVIATLDESVNLFIFATTEHLLPNASAFLYLVARLLHTQKISGITVQSHTLCGLIAHALRWESQKPHFAEYAQQLCNCARFMVRNQNTLCCLRDLAFVGSDFDLNTLSNDTCVSLLLLVTQVAVRDESADVLLENTVGPLPVHLQHNPVLKYSLFQALVTSYKLHQPRRTYSERWASFLLYTVRDCPLQSERDIYYNLRFLSFFFLLTKSTFRSCVVVAVGEFLNTMWTNQAALLSERTCVQWLKIANILFIAWPRNTETQLHTALMKLVQDADFVQSPRVFLLRKQMMRFAMHEYALDAASKQDLYALCFDTKLIVQTKADQDQPGSKTTR